MHQVWPSASNPHPSTLPAHTTNGRDQTVEHSVLAHTELLGLPFSSRYVRLADSSTRSRANQSSNRFAEAYSRWHCHPFNLCYGGSECNTILVTYTSVHFRSSQFTPTVHLRARLTTTLLLVKQVSGGYVLGIQTIGNQIAVPVPECSTVLTYTSIHPFTSPFTPTMHLDA